MIARHTLKRAQLTIPLAFCLLVQLACDLPTDADNVVSDRINFSDLQVGQTSSYISFAVGGYWGQEPTFEYTYDSLVITITSEQGGSYLVTERFVDVDTTDWWNGNDTLTYTLEVLMDTLWYRTIGSSSRFSWIYEWLSPLALPLEPAGEELTLNDWRPVYPTGACCLYTVDTMDILDHIYGPLNVNLIDDTPVDGPAIWWFYSGTDGIVRQFAINPWINSGKGWDLLP